MKKLLVLMVVVLTMLSACATTNKGVVVIPAEQFKAVDSIARMQIPELVDHYHRLYTESRAPTEEEYLKWQKRWREAKRLYMEELLPGLDSATAFYRILKDIGMGVFGDIL